MVLQPGGSRRQRLEIQVDGTLLRQVDTFNKYLGFIMVPSMSPAAHVIRATAGDSQGSCSLCRPNSQAALHLELCKLKVYLSCYVESQFYALELTFLSVLDSMRSGRSFFYSFGV
jgi:hypothetical protein